MGTEVGRELLGGDVWVNAAFNAMKPGVDYCIPDMRFPNEAKRIVDNGGLIFRINREGFGPANSHYSEIALDDWDYDHVIENNSDIEYLRQVADNIYR